jgi:hypothetical protein
VVTIRTGAIPDEYDVFSFAANLDVLIAPVPGTVGLFHFSSFLS